MTEETTSFFCFMQDVLDVGAERLCDSIEELGVGGVTVAVSYHASRDFRPRGVGGRFIDFDPGAHYFPADRELYPDSMQPWTPVTFAEPDRFDELRDVTRRRHMPLTAWTVFGFNDRLGRRDPELCEVNAFGDRYLTDLCPANPRYRSYALALASDVMRYRPDSLLAESLHYHPLREPRRFLELDAPSRVALGLCFCEHCEAAARQEGVAVDRVRAWARNSSERAFAGDLDRDAPPDGSWIAAVADGELLRYLGVRAAVVTSLAAAVANIVALAGGKLVYMDQAAAGERVVGPTAADDALRFGVDLAALAGVVHGYQVLCYSRSADDVARALAEYRRRLGPAVTIRAALRPSWPDCLDAANLKAKVDAARRLGVAGIDFYHYGLVSDDALARVSSVIRAYVE